MDTNPETYGLSVHTKLVELGENNIGIVRLLKSRIIQKDAAKLVDMAVRIRRVNPGCRVSVICYPNICSKSLALLAKADVAVVYEKA